MKAEIIPGHNQAKVTIQLNSCPVCKNKMVEIPRPNEYLGNLYHLFPKFYKDKLIAQLEQAEIRFRSNIKLDDYYIC